MTQTLPREQIEDRAIVHALPPQPAAVDTDTRTATDRSFEMPTGLYVTTVALYLGFVATLGLPFGSAGLAIPLAIFALTIVAGFGVPALWVRMQPENNSHPLAWQRFLTAGIQTLTGPVKARDAAVQMLVLPVLIALWGIAFVTMRAFI